MLNPITFTPKRLARVKLGGLTQWSSLTFTVALNIYKFVHKQSRTKICNGLLSTFKFRRHGGAHCTFKTLPQTVRTNGNFAFAVKKLKS